MLGYVFRNIVEVGIKHQGIRFFLIQQDPSVYKMGSIKNPRGYTAPACLDCRIK